MSDPDFTLAKARVAIIGLGLMGGSLALDLEGKCAALHALDPDAETRALARTRRIVDKISGDPAEILPQADLIVLAAPVQAIVTWLHDLPQWCAAAAVVVDLGSTKAKIVSVMSQLPERFDPIGGHPMCGREVSSLVHAYSGLYRGAPFALTPLPRTTDRARRLATELVQAVGANLLWLDAGTHDRWVAATSHLPYLVANALAAATPVPAASLVGPGFLSSTRLAGSSQQMMLDILSTNREAVLAALDRFSERLATVQQQLTDEDWKALARSLAEGAAGRQELIA